MSKNTDAEFAPHQPRPQNGILRRLPDHPASHEMLTTTHVLAGFENFGLTLGQGRQTDLLTPFKVRDRERALAVSNLLAEHSKRQTFRTVGKIRHYSLFAQ